MNEYPLMVRVCIVMFTIWLSLNTGLVAFNLVSQWYIAALQAPSVIQQEKARGDALQRQLEAERAKKAPETPKP